MSRPAVILLARRPILGCVKTRLHQGIGRIQALAVYEHLLKTVIEQLMQCGAPIYVYWHRDGWPDKAVSDSFRCWWQPRQTSFIQRHQPGGDLGARMHVAFTELFSQGHDRVIVVGSDFPGPLGLLIRHAFAALDQCDAVLGPCVDGGYYLLGIKECWGPLFEAMPWSTDRLLEQSLKRLHADAKIVQLLDLGCDIDDPADLVHINRHRHWKHVTGTMGLA